MSFRLSTIFYVFALVAAALATFGLAGLCAAALVLGFWAWLFYLPKRITLLNLLQLAVVGLVLLALLLPAISTARHAALRNQCSSNLKHIAIALLNYHDVRGTYPPAFVADAKGKPMHSWRVLILPFADEPALYKQYNFNEPWDGPNNRKLAAQTPEIFRCPAREHHISRNPFEANYFAIVAPESAWGRPLMQVSDGTSKTIMVIEATGFGIHWMEPRDVTLEEAIELLTTKPRSGHWHVDDGLLTTTYHETSARNVAFCDGHTVWMEQFDDTELARALLTAARRETFAWQNGRPPATFREAKMTTIIKWGKVWGLSVFVVLSLLPAAWVRQRRREATQHILEQDAPGDA